MDRVSFRVPQKAVIRQGDGYLIIKRNPKAYSYPDHWDFPGGKIEAGEKPEKALAREVLEETGLQVRPVRPVHVFSEVYGKFNYFMVVWEAELLSGEVELSEEHTDFRWATREEILKLPKVERFLKDYLKKFKD